ncbi:hypothetical protein C3E97_008640 [Pseudomonas sp. MWU12-2115]|nr:hypothetical protein C3E97_008640 [Pseudomonas sp. MWU12-2115]
MIGVGSGDGRTRYPQIRQQGLWVNNTETCCPPIQCGSGLARESGGSFNFDAAETTLSRASPLPQGVFSVWRIVASARRPLRSEV